MARKPTPTEPLKRSKSRVTRPAPRPPRVGVESPPLIKEAAAPAKKVADKTVAESKIAETPPLAVKAEPVSPPPATMPVAAPIPEPKVELAVPEPVLSTEDVIAAVSTAAEIMSPSPESNPVLKGMTEMATTEKVQTMFTDMSDRAKTALEKSSKFGEEFADLTKGNLEAIAESTKIAVKSAEALAQEAADYSKKSFESATAAMKRYSAVKSPVELIQLNGEYVKTSFDSAIAEASKVSETLTKMLNDVFQPLSSRYAVASEKLKSAAF